MGTDWSKASGGGVVALTLGLALGCGGKYSVGSGDTGGQAGEAGSGDATTGGASGSSGSGGSSGSAQGGASTGGSTTIGGRGGSIGVGGGSVGGSSAGGSSAGGSAGASSCGTPHVVLPEFELAEPEEVWYRLSRFMHGSGTRPPFDPLPETTTVEWVRDRVRVILDEQFVEDELAPGGFADFVRGWAFEGNEEANVDLWAAAFARPEGNFSELFGSMGDRVSFMSDRNFLVAHPNSTRRGMWMLNDLLCTPVPGPPPEIDIEPVTVPPGKTRRQTIEENVADPVCAGCHALIDPLGFSLEHYDALGDYRTTENGLPIDSSGYFDGIEFSSIDDLAGQLPTRCEVQECFAHKLFQYAIYEAHEGSIPPSYDVELPYVVNEFSSHNLALGSLIEAIATTPTFLSR